MSSLARSSIRLIIVFVLSVSPFWWWSVSWPEEISPWALLSEPIEKQEVVGKFPMMQVDFVAGVTYDSLVVILDGVDVTQLIKKTEKGFDYIPPFPLAAGDHILVLKSTISGTEQELSFQFSSRQYDQYKEATTRTDLSATYEQTIAESPGQTGPEAKVDFSMQTSNKVAKSDWSVSFGTNLHYAEQRGGRKIPIDGYNGVSLSGLVLTGKYDLDSISCQFDVGDVDIEQSELSLSYLSRKGATFSIATDILELELFRVRSDELYSLDGYDFIGASGNDLSGISATMDLFDQSVVLSAYFASGSQGTSSFESLAGRQSFGFSASDTAQKGSLTGLMVETDFWESLLTTECEFGLSSHDPDQSDDRPAISDTAYRLKVGSEYSQYIAAVQYEYYGPEYGVVGNPAVSKDKAGFSGTGQLDFEKHDILLTLSRMADNLDEDGMVPVNINSNGTLEYTYSDIPDWPLTCSVSKSFLETTDSAQGPSGPALASDQVLDRYMINLNHVSEQTTYNISGSFSSIDDQTEQDLDSAAYTASFTPSFSTTNFTFSPTLTLTRAKAAAIKGETKKRITDTVLLNVVFTSHMWNDLVSFDVSGSYLGISTNDSTPDSDGLTAQVRLAIDLDTVLPTLVKPVLAIKGSYSYTSADSAQTRVIDYFESDALGDETDIYQIYAVFGLCFPFAL